MHTELVSNLQNLWECLKNEEYDTLLGYFKKGVDLDVPTFGRITNDTIFKMFATRVTKWLKKNEVVCEYVDATIQENRVVMEYLLYYHRNSEILDVPVAVVFDLDGEKITAARGYYQTTNITGQIDLRYALMNRDWSIDPPHPSHALYFRSIKEKSVEGVLEATSEDCAIGLGHGIKRGVEAVRASFTKMFNEGYVILHYCTETSDERKAAYEFFIERKGDLIRTPQSGIAVYGKRPGDGKLDYIRIYQEPINDHRLHYYNN